MEQINETVVAEESVVVTKRGRKPKEEAVVEASEQLETVKADHKYEMLDEDLIATLYTYAPSPVKKGNFSQTGKCLICGVSTAAVERKVCWECLQKHRDDIVTW